MKIKLLFCFFVFSVIYGMRLSRFDNGRQSFSDQNDRFLGEYRRLKRNLGNRGFGDGPLEMNDDAMMNQMDNNYRRDRINQELNGFYNYADKNQGLNTREFRNEFNRYKQDLESNFDEGSNYQMNHENMMDQNRNPNNRRFGFGKKYRTGNVHGFGKRRRKYRNLNDNF